METWINSLRQLRVRDPSLIFLDFLTNSIPDSQNVAADDKFMIFEKWLLDNGAKFPKLELKVCLLMISPPFFSSQ
jgi:hypothetical protein